ncbi:MAG TPA: phosphoglucosamine mutase [Methanomassiliicoccales archaeon]|nr:phosphoglucosamine mutase [Methanomassiliicoccales archaeon]
MPKRLFGTNGVRGVVNDFMDPQLALDVGRAIGTFMKGRVAMATDCRTSADMIRSAVAAGLASVGCEVLDLGALPTPALQYFVKVGEISGGVMVTASHNPPEFNGIKAIDADGTEMHRSREEEIERIYFSRSFDQKDWKGVGAIKPASGAMENYQKAVLSLMDIDAIRKARLRVVLDCANGAGSLCSPVLLQRLGASALTLNCNPEGTFPGHPSEPVEENLVDLISLVEESGADLGIAQDGDADRAIFIDDKGRYVHGDRSLAVVAAAMVSENEGGVVVTPVSTSQCVEDAVRAAGGEVVYTRVGAPIVARRMMELGAVFGGEENGGLIFPRHQYCRDAAMSMAKMLEIVAIEGSLSSALAKVPAYHLDKRKLRCPDERKERVLREVCEAFSANKIDTTDGVKVYFEGGWSLVRPSGTEPIFRVYSEGKDKATAKRIADRCEKVVKEILGEQ